MSDTEIHPAARLKDIEKRYSRSGFKQYPEDIEWLIQTCKDFLRRAGIGICETCGKPIELDRDSGFWMHQRQFTEEDGRPRYADGKNGLYCYPKMWESGEPKVHARPQL